MRSLFIFLCISVTLVACNGGGSTSSSNVIPNGKFVLAGSQGAIYSSLSSISNAFYPTAILQNIKTICGEPTAMTYGSNKYVIVANESNNTGTCIAQSTNAKDWDEFILNNNIANIASIMVTSDNMFILGGNGLLLSGSDLHKLQEHSFIAGKLIKKLIQDNQTIIALCSDNTIYYASINDLDNWIEDINFSEQNNTKINDITIGDDYVIAVGTNARILFTARNNYPNNINWNSYSSNLKSNQEIKFIAYGNGKYVGITSSNMLSNLGPTSFVINEKTLSFDSVNNLQLNPITSLTFGAGYFMLTAQSSGLDAGVNTSANSIDGVNWNNGIILSSLPLIGIPIIRVATFGSR